MKIRFNEARVFLDQSRVNAGEEMDFPDDEAFAFVANGVAEVVADPAPAKRKVSEVTDNG